MNEPYNAAIGLARPEKPFWAKPEAEPRDPRDFFINVNSTEWTEGFALHTRHWRLDSYADSYITFGAADLAGEGAFMNILDDYFWSGLMEGVGTWTSNIVPFANSTQAVSRPEGVYTIFDSA